MRAKILHGGYAEKLGWKPDQYDQRQLRMGTEHELEHTNDRELARGISMDHLAEQVLNGEEQDYYDRIAKLESNPSHPQLLRDWSRLVNMTSDELEEFLAAPEGKVAGMTRTEAARMGIRSGHDSARAILRMKEKDPDHWTRQDWDWAQRQVNFIRRMGAVPGKLWDDRGQPTRKLLSLMLWGHLPDEVIELHEQQFRTVRPGRRRMHSNRATHPFRSVEYEYQRRGRASSDEERRRFRQHRFVIAGIDQKGNDWSLGSAEELTEALARARTQRTYPRAIVVDLDTGDSFE